jgi:hypothetical protein
VLPLCIVKFDNPAQFHAPQNFSRQENGEWDDARFCWIQCDLNYITDMNLSYQFVTAFSRYLNFIIIIIIIIII